LRDDRLFTLTEDGITMSETVFCYHCRRHHPGDEVILIESRGVKRWRCRTSIFASRGSADQRDAFGKTISAQNRTGCARPAARPLPRPVLELFGGAGGSFENLA
jgi:hypothetical protein